MPCPAEGDPYGAQSILTERRQRLTLGIDVTSIAERTCLLNLTGYCAGCVKPGAAQKRSVGSMRRDEKR